jgi:hypothetical protein
MVFGPSPGRRTAGCLGPAQFPVRRGRSLVRRSGTSLGCTLHDDHWAGRRSTIRCSEQRQSPGAGTRSRPFLMDKTTKILKKSGASDMNRTVAARAEAAQPEPTREGDSKECVPAVRATTAARRGVKDFREESRSEDVERTPLGRIQYRSWEWSRPRGRQRHPRRCRAAIPQEGLV